MSKRKAGATAKRRPDNLKASEGATLRCIRFGGVSLGGGKTDRTAVVTVEFYPDHKKLFLRKIVEKIKPSELQTTDQILLDILTDESQEMHSITFDTPTSLPVCLKCDCKAPDYSGCPRAEVKWMWDIFRERSPSKRPNKMFTPYTERAAEIYISHFLEERFYPHHALGANMAPLTARAVYLRSRLTSLILETHPKLSMWRIGRHLKLSKSNLRSHRHSGDSDDLRLSFLMALMDRGITFLYQQDLKLLVENWHAFEAFLCALVGFLHYQGQTQVPPGGFPKESAWLSFPNEEIEWFGETERVQEGLVR